MSVQRVTITTYAPAITGNVSRVTLVSQAVTGPAGADGAGVSVAVKEAGTEKVAVTTVLDFGAGFDVAGAAGVASVSLDLTEYAGGALPLAAGGTGATDAAGARTALGLGTAATQASSAFDAAGSASSVAAAAAAAIAGHEADTTNVHGIADTSVLATAASLASALAHQAEFATIAIGDETTAITTGTAKVTWRAPFAFTLIAVRASLTTASSSGIPTFDINEGGTTILSTKLTIDANELTSTTAATAAVISDASIADDASLTIDVDVAGTGAAGAKITLYFTRNP